MPADGSRIAAEELAGSVRLVVFDVDGVMTDGGLYYDGEGRIFKRYHVHDGVAIRFLREAGLLVGVITAGMDGACVETRMRRLQVDAFYQGDISKQAALEDMRRRFGVEWREMAYVGDDWVDLIPMRMVGLPVAVSNARREVKELAAYVTEAAGGEGAVREVAEWLLACQGKLETRLREWGTPAPPDPGPAEAPVVSPAEPLAAAVHAVPAEAPVAPPPLAAGETAPPRGPSGTESGKRWLRLVGVAILAALLFCSGGRSAPAAAPGSEEEALLDAATLALKGISLMQGEGGFEYWRLRANWASMDEKDGAIDVREPVVRYNLGENGQEDFVHVVAGLGRISDNQRVLTLWRDVVLTHGDAVLTGPRLVYHANSRRVVFPEGAELENGDVSGLFTTLTWYMNTRVIEGEQGISLVFKARGGRDAGVPEPAADLVGMKAE
jgi:3-deoxy-D-manno-octulosonate 8-phosphate phosphatase (KDO 8-P phosphatase)